jgi:enterobacteria phage integrase
MAARRREAKRRGWPDYLYQNTKGYFYWRDPDTKKDHGLGTDRTKAFNEARAANLAVQQRRGAITLAQKILEPEGKTLAVWCDEYEEKYERTRTDSVASIKTMKAGVRAIRKAPFVSLNLRKITTKQVSDFIDEATTARGPSMAALIRKTLVDMFREAETKGLIETGKNPVTVTRQPDTEAKRSRLTLERFQAIQKIAAEMDPWVARSMELALVTGQRRDDIARMKFADAKEGFLWVEQSKTGKRIRIPLALRLDALGMSVEDVIRSCRDSIVSKSILHYDRTSGASRPGSAVRPNSLTRAFMRARDAAAIEWEKDRTPATFHEIRSLAARLYTEQYGAEFSQALLGHASATMTDLYRDARGAEWTEVKISGRKI